MARPLLLVEDSDSDAEALFRLSRQLPLSPPIIRVHSGESALDFLHRRGDYVNALRPSLVLLDLHLPGIGGREVLADLKADPELRSIPVIIFSSSEAPSDVEGAYASGANSYLHKPPGGLRLQTAAQALQAFWFTAAILPGDKEPPQ